MLDMVIWLLISMYLYVDTLSGVLMGGDGGQAPLSQAWKGLIFLLILAASVRRSPTTVLLISGLGLALIFAPFYRLFTSPSVGSAVWEMTTALKVLLPLAVLSWCNDQRKAGHQLLWIWPRRALWIFVSALFVNLLLGALGFGYATYSAGGVNIGITGYFTAGNEVGALFAVLCGFVLVEMWGRRKIFYIITALVFVAASLAIATKSAMLSAVLLVVLVPFVSYRERWDRLPASIAVALGAAFMLLAVAAVHIWAVLEVAGLADKLRDVYAVRGWAGVLFSGRDIFIQQAFQAIIAADSFFDILFGPGIHKLRTLGIKESVEVDPLDLYLWFGFPGCLVAAVFALMFLFVPIRAKNKSKCRAAPAIALTTWLMLAISVIAGHVILAGIPGIAWATFTAIALTSGVRSAPSPRSNIASEPGPSRYKPAT